MATNKIQINRLTNANVYLNGSNKLGRVEKIDLSDIKFKMSEHKSLGMAGSVEFPSGFDKVELKIKWNAFYSDILLAVASPSETLDLQVRGSLETRASGGKVAEEPVKIFLRATPKNFPLGNFQQHDNVEVESTFNVLYIKMEIGSVEVMEYDPLANIYKVNGVDQLEKYRNNIGA